MVPLELTLESGLQLQEWLPQDAWSVMVRSQPSQTLILACKFLKYTRVISIGKAFSKGLH